MNPAVRQLLMGRSQKPGAFGYAKDLVRKNAADVTILVLGDSTGNGNDEWVYLFGQFLASEHPTHSVSYRLWNDTLDVYDAAVALGAGSGSNTIRIWNGSVGGAVPRHFMGGKFGSAIGVISPDLVIWNYGHNIVSAGQYRAKMMEAIEQVRQSKPNAAHAYMRQNPNRDDVNMAVVVDALDGIASDYGDIQLLDAYSAFTNAGRPSAWYTDNIHPNATGQSEGMLPPVRDAWRRASILTRFAPAFVNTAAANLLTNGDFAAFTAALPDSWTQSGNGTVSKETIIVDGTSPHSVKIVNGTTATDIRQSITATPYRGMPMTLAARQYVAAGGTSNTGRVRIFSNGTSPPFEVNDSGTVGVGGFKWIMVSGFIVPADATSITVALYADSGTTAGGTGYYDRAILVAGTLPRDMP